MDHERQTIFTRNFWWLAGIAACLPVAWFLYQLFGPNERIIVSPETTVITEPLRPDGLPDYARYFYELGHDGVTPENNGAVEFWQAMWPGDLAPEDWLPMCDALGMEKVPKEGSGLEAPYSAALERNVAKWLHQHYQDTLQGAELDRLSSDEGKQIIETDLSGQAISEAMERPWQKEQLPPLEEWVERNKQQLDLLVAASKKSKFWSPSPSLLGDRYNGAIAILLPYAQSVRNAVRALNLRAMWYLGSGRQKEAWEDLLACFRLARSTAQGPTTVEQLVAIAIDGITCQQTVTLLNSPDLEPKLASQILHELKEMGPSSNVVETINSGERIIFADIVLGLASQPETLSSLTGIGGPQFDPMALVNINWNYVLREGNRCFDQLVAAARLPTSNERKAAFRGIGEAIDQADSSARNPIRLLSGVISTQARSEILADVLVSLLSPAMLSACRAEERGIVTWELTRVAAALAVHRAERGEYPEQLTALVPGILPELPLDLYVGEPFKYERKPDGGYLLYSVFKNKQDEGGTSFTGEIVAGEWVDERADTDYDKSDMVFRVPVPEFKLPEFPVEEETVANPVD